MSSDRLAYAPATELAEMVRSRRVSPIEITEAALRRIDASQPLLNAFITVARDEAMAEARLAEEAVARGDDLGPLHGVPFSVKDLVNTRGVRTTMGSLIFEHNVPDTDAISVARLRAAGAIMVGKTTTPEFGHKPFTRAPLFGDTPNAWDRDRTCAAERRHRRRRLDPDSGGRKRGGRHEGDPGHDPARRGAGLVWRQHLRRTHNAHRRRRRPHVAGDVRPAPVGCSLDGPATPGFS